MHSAAAVSTTASSFLPLSGNLPSTNIRIDPNLTKGIGVDDLRRLCILRLSFVKVPLSPPCSLPPRPLTPSHPHLMLSHHSFHFPSSHPSPPHTRVCSHPHSHPLTCSHPHTHPLTLAHAHTLTLTPSHITLTRSHLTLTHSHTITPSPPHSLPPPHPGLGSGLPSAEHQRDTVLDRDHAAPSTAAARQRPAQHALRVPDPGQPVGLSDPAHTHRRAHAHHGRRGHSALPAGSPRQPATRGRGGDGHAAAAPVLVGLAISSHSMPVSSIPHLAQPHPLPALGSHCVCMYVSYSIYNIRIHLYHRYVLPVILSCT